MAAVAATEVCRLDLSALSEKCLGCPKASHLTLAAKVSVTFINCGYYRLISFA